MNSEILKKWEPILSIPDKLYLTSLLDDKNGFRIELVGESDTPIFKFQFESVLAYRNVDESDRLKFLDEITGQLEWSLYLVDNSKFLDWFHDQSYSIHSSEDIQHYLFFTPNDIVDILSFERPSVTCE